jgi:hypothetical protein
MSVGHKKCVTIDQFTSTKVIDNQADHFIVKPQREI